MPRIKPGSLDERGRVIDIYGIPQERVAWVPIEYGVRLLHHVIGRCDALNKAGWRIIGPRHERYPSIPPRDPFDRKQRPATCLIRIDQ